MPIVSTPIGMVVPFFLQPNQIKALAPDWLPADGSVVHNSNSPYNGKKLPDLSDSFVLGAPANTDLAPEAPANSQTAQTSLTVLINISTRTNKLVPSDMTDFQGQVVTSAPPLYVVDTSANEISSSNHSHSIDITGSSTVALPLPPFARLIYMVKVL